MARKTFGKYAVIVPVTYHFKQEEGWWWKIAPPTSGNELEMQRFMAKHGIDKFVMNPHFPVNTLLAMRGAIAARELGCVRAYDEAMFAGMWEQGLKLDLPDVWERAVTAVGLPAAQLAELAASPEVKAQLVANTEAAVARGVFGSPTFFLGDDMWFGKERLRDVEEAAAA
jgi:2-hydroxychromene-2-carboxylate isomerase